MLMSTKHVGMPDTRICQKCRTVFRGNTCTKCGEQIVNYGILATLKALKIEKNAKNYPKEKPVRKHYVAPSPFDLMPNKTLWNMLLVIQGTLVRHIITCNGDFELESKPALQELRDDLVSINNQLRKREQVCVTPPKEKLKELY